MPNIGPMELIIVLIVALLILGPKRLPTAGRSLGRGINEFKSGISGNSDERAIGTARATDATRADTAATDAPATEEGE